jgi:hypothetical protein
VAEDRELGRETTSFKLRGNVGPGVTALAISVLAFIGALILLRDTPPDAVLTTMLLGVPIAIGAFAAWLTRGATVVVGEDGVRIERALGRRFLPIREIEGVTSRSASIEIKLSSGETVSLTSLDTLVVGAITQALETRDLRRRDAHARLARRGRPLKDWLEDLSGLLGRGAFREEAIGADEVSAVLDDATQPLEQRLGAAIALSKSGQAARARIAADASANPKIRIALSKIAGDDDPLAEVEALLEAEAQAEAALSPLAKRGGTGG